MVDNSENNWNNSKTLFLNVVFSLAAGAPYLEELYLGDNAMHTVTTGVGRELLLLPRHVGQLAQFSRLKELELGRLDS